MAEEQLHVAIIGGGLCGLSLAIALTKRSISHTIYEARGSFTDIGAGINLGPNTVEAFGEIDPEIRDAIFAFATRNPGQERDVWMNLRLGAATREFEDARLIHQIRTPKSGTGNMTVSRNELLQFLARQTNPDNARFNKKLKFIVQDGEGVSFTFEDDTTEKASVLIACDGAHSIIRRIVVGADSPAASPVFSETGVYRAVLPMTKLESLIGKEQANVSTIRVGPEGYFVTYPIDGGANVNMGAWPLTRGDWPHKTWILPNQKAQAVQDFKRWGPTVQKMIDAMDDDAAFWAGFHHAVYPEKYWDGRVCLIGDASHAMGPHQGQGASQSMEDACVMAEVLQDVASGNVGTVAQRIEAAFAGYELARKPRFEKVVETSKEALSFWADLWKPELSSADIDAFTREADRRFQWLWEPDITGQGLAARAEMKRLLEKSK